MEPGIAESSESAFVILVPSDDLTLQDNDKICSLNVSRHEA